MAETVKNRFATIRANFGSKTLSKSIATQHYLSNASHLVNYASSLIETKKPDATLPNAQKVEPITSISTPSYHTKEGAASFSSKQAEVVEKTYTCWFQLLEYYKEINDSINAKKIFEKILSQLIHQNKTSSISSLPLDVRALFQFVNYFSYYRTSENKDKISLVIYNIVHRYLYLDKNTISKDSKKYLSNQLLPLILKYCNDNEKNLSIDDIIQVFQLYIPNEAEKINFFSQPLSKIDIIRQAFASDSQPILNNQTTDKQSEEKNSDSAPKQRLLDNTSGTHNNLPHHLIRPFPMGYQNRIALHINKAIDETLKLFNKATKKPDSEEKPRERINNFLSILVDCQEKNSINDLIIQENEPFKSISKNLLLTVANDCEIILKKQELDYYRLQNDKPKIKETEFYFACKYYASKYNISIDDVANHIATKKELSLEQVHNKLRDIHTKQIESYLLANNFKIPQIGNTHDDYLLNQTSYQVYQRYLALLNTLPVNNHLITEARILLHHLMAKRKIEDLDINLTDPKLIQLVNNYKQEKHLEITLFALWNQYSICDDPTAKKKIENELITQLNIPIDEQITFLIFRKNKQKVIEQAFEKRGYGLTTYTRYSSYTQQHKNIKIARQQLLDYYKELNSIIIKKLNNNETPSQEDQQTVEEINQLLYCLARDNHFDEFKLPTFDSNNANQEIKWHITTPALIEICSNFETNTKQTSKNIYGSLRRVFEDYLTNPTYGCFEDVELLFEFLNMIGFQDYSDNKIEEIVKSKKSNINESILKDLTNFRKLKGENTNEQDIKLNYLEYRYGKLRNAPEHEGIYAFHKYLVKKFLQLQDTHFNTVTSAQKTATLMAYKRAINNFGQHINSSISLTNLNETTKLLYSCERLIDQLPPGHPAIQLFNKQLYKGTEDRLPPLNPDHAKARYSDSPFKAQSEFKAWKKEIDTLNARENEKVDLLKLKWTIIKTLKQEKICYYDEPLLYKVDNAKPLRKEKQSYRLKKKINHFLSYFSASVLASGQAALGVYALLGLAPILGGFINIIASIALFASFWTNFNLFRESTRITSKQFLLKDDWFNGFTTPSGKVVMIIALLAALMMGITMAIMVAVSISSVIPFPPVSIPLAGLLSFSTFIGYTSIMYRAIANRIKLFCSYLENKFPEIITHGWGITGLYKGVSQGLQRIWQKIQTPGSYSAQGGLRNAVKEKLSRMWNKFWVNPVYKINPTSEEIYLKRTENIVKLILYPLFAIAALGFFALATYGMVLAMHNEITGFLTNESKNPMFTLSTQVASWISYGMVIGIAGSVRALFNYVNIRSFFSQIADYSIIKVANCVKEVGKLIFKKDYAKTQAQAFTQSIQKKYQSVKNFITNTSYRTEKIKQWKNDPQRYLFNFLHYCKSRIIDGFSILFNATTSFALTLKGDLELNQAQSIEDVSEFGASRAFSAGATSLSINTNEAKTNLAKEPLIDIPLQSQRKQTKTYGQQTSSLYKIQDKLFSAPSSIDINSSSNPSDPVPAVTSMCIKPSVSSTTPVSSISDKNKHVEARQDDAEQLVTPSNPSSTAYPITKLIQTETNLRSQSENQLSTTISASDNTLQPGIPYSSSGTDVFLSTSSSTKKVKGKNSLRPSLSLKGEALLSGLSPSSPYHFPSLSPRHPGSSDKHKRANSFSSLGSNSSTENSMSSGSSTSSTMSRSASSESLATDSDLDYSLFESTSKDNLSINRQSGLLQKTLFFNPRLYRSSSANVKLEKTLDSSDFDFKQPLPLALGGMEKGEPTIPTSRTIPAFLVTCPPAAEFEEDLTRTNDPKSTIRPTTTG